MTHVEFSVMLAQTKLIFHFWMLPNRVSKMFTQQILPGLVLVEEQPPCTSNQLVRLFVCPFFFWWFSLWVSPVSAKPSLFVERSGDAPVIGDTALGQSFRSPSFFSFLASSSVSMSGSKSTFMSSSSSLKEARVELWWGWGGVFGGAGATSQLSGVCSDHFSSLVPVSGSLSHFFLLARLPFLEEDSFLFRPRRGMNVVVGDYFRSMLAISFFSDDDKLFTW